MSMIDSDFKRIKRLEEEVAALKAEIQRIKEVSHYSTGDIFYHILEDEYYILSQVGADTVSLISLGTSSNRFLDPIKVNNTSGITAIEFDVISGHEASLFSEVDVNIVRLIVNRL